MNPETIAFLRELTNRLGVNLEHLMEAMTYRSLGLGALRLIFGMAFVILANFLYRWAERQPPNNGYSSQGQLYGRTIVAYCLTVFFTLFAISWIYSGLLVLIAPEADALLRLLNALPQARS